MKEKTITLNMKKLNVLAIVSGILVQVLSCILWYALWGYPTLVDYGMEEEMTYSEAEAFFTKRILLFIIFILIGTILHELIHGLTWAIFAPKHFKNIKFGIIWKYIMPYCHCDAALPLNYYRIGGLTPLVILGLCPYFLGLFGHSLSIMIFGLFLTLGAIGDIEIVWKTRNIPNSQLILDHPTEPGFIIFEEDHQE